MSNHVTVVIPAHNGLEHLRKCLAAVQSSVLQQPIECIVVDDGSDQPVSALASENGATVLRSDERHGPAHARNLGARAAQGDILLFLDADVCVHPDTISKILARFENDSRLDAVFGSYDGRTMAPGFITRYKDLQHCFEHQHGREEASTFWSGCGAIRKRVFLEHGGFDERYTRPAIEDIDLGVRLVRANRRIQLDRDLQVTHLKTWTFWGLLKNDMMCRGIPWAELILRSRSLPNDLNLRLNQRLSVALIFLCLAAIPVVGFAGGAAVALGAFLLNAEFYRFAAERRGAWFAAATVPVHFLYHLNCGVSLMCGVACYFVAKPQPLPCETSAAIVVVSSSPST